MKFISQPARQLYGFLLLPRQKKSPAVSFEIREGFPISYKLTLPLLEVVSNSCGPGVALYAAAVLVLVGDAIGEIAFGCLYAKSAIPAACIGDIEAECIACAVEADFVGAITVAEGPYVADFCCRADGPAAVLDVYAVAQAEREHPYIGIIAVMTYADAVGVSVSAEVCIAESCKWGQCAHAKADASFSSDSDAVCVAVGGSGDGLAGVLLGEIIAAMQVGDVAKVSHSALFDSAIESEAVVVSVVFCMSSCGVAGEVSIYIGECCASGCAAILVEVAADDNAIEL